VGTEPFFEKEPVRPLVAGFRKIYYSHVKNEKPPEYKAIDVIREMITNKEKIFDIMKALMLDIEIPSGDKKRLKKLVNIYGSDYDKFFLNVSMRRGVDDYDSRAEAVSIMTIHASKGLEFKTVFIPGCEEGIIPFEVFGKKNTAELAEEERLFYVGITRTQKYLYLSHARRRHFQGRTLYQKKSLFLDRVEKQLIKSGRREPKLSGTGDVQMDLF
jgi:superfamily I DNA/RNA helicase